MMWLFWAATCLIQQAVASEESLSGRHLNPQEFMTVNEVIHYWGYVGEEYEILTDDGYYLKVNRIPFGIHSPGKKGPKPAVLLGHGLLAEGRCWIANLPSNSLGFFLADAGYDVWIINFRGTTWSRRHQNLSIHQEEFWDFSIHEMGIYDIPATINFILKKTKQDSLYYLGHSQGSAVGVIAFSVLPQLVQKVKLFICLTPGYTGVGGRGLIYVLIKLPDGLRRLIWGNKEYCILSTELKSIVAELCSYPVIDKLCIQPFFYLGGFNEKNLNVSRADVYIGIYPDFTSVKTVSHWGQVFCSEEFKYFDYGSTKNKAIYNSTRPPFYKIEDMLVPTAVWSGGKDIATPLSDIKLLMARITHLVFHKHIPDWEHFDPPWGLDAPERMYPDVLNLMNKYKT